MGRPRQHSPVTEVALHRPGGGFRQRPDPVSVEGREGLAEHAGAQRWTHIELTGEYPKLDFAKLNFFRKLGGWVQVLLGIFF